MFISIDVLMIHEKRLNFRNVKPFSVDKIPLSKPKQSVVTCSVKFTNSREVCVHVRN